ncbi:MAG: IS630 family transposase [Gammaproteobacteria bacterium]|nr:IS630 family transposase [Gammaproteobacteria bacterium]NBY21529.1 IS630 family transposase [Gammaproteobacteria bacterium]NDG86368.1 IS630 family transposase [Gammaproteobacteria bacterium]
MKCKRDSDARSHDHHALQVMRQQAVKAVRNGETATSVAAAMGVNIRTVFRWLADFAEGGQNALLAKPIPGRPPILDADQLQWIAKTVKDHTPQQMRFEFALWTLSLVGEVIYQKFGKRLSAGSLSRVMRILGYTPQKPKYLAWQQDPILVETWRTEIFPAVKAEAKETGAVIYFADEAGIRSDYRSGTTWAPQGETPTVKVTGRRFGLNMISAISSKGDFRFMIQEGTVTAQVFRDFLKRLMVGAKQPIILVVDGHPIHQSKLVKTFVEEQNGKLKLVVLPPYSPQLNPDEQVWGWVKPRVIKQLPQNMAELKRLVMSSLRRLQKLPDVVRSFFRHPDCQYALT